MKIVVLGAPSGVGKNSVMDGLLDTYPDVFLQFPSIASRPMRPGESQGKPYFFVTGNEFLEKVRSGDVFEYTDIHGDFRGMSASIIDEFGKTGKLLIKDCDYIGVLALKEKYGADNVTAIFLTAPRDVAELRIRKRGETEEYTQMRLANYDREMATAHHFDHVVESITVEQSVNDIMRLLN